MRLSIRKMLTGLLALFLLPLCGARRPLCQQRASRELPPGRLVERRHAAAGGGRSRRAPPGHRPAAPARWKGIFAVHSWVVLKPENATSWTRYDVVGWGHPVRTNGWAPDGRWYRQHAARTARYAAARRPPTCIPQGRGCGRRLCLSSSTATIASGPARTATPSPPPYCVRCRNCRWRCRRTPSAATSATALCGPHRQRHRRRDSIAHGAVPGFKARLGRGRRSQPARAGRRPRSAPSGGKAAGLRAHRCSITARRSRPPRPSK